MKHFDRGVPMPEPASLSLESVGHLLVGLAIKWTDEEFASGTTQFACTDSEKLREEVFALRMFAIDYLTFMVMGDTPEKNKILDAAYGLLEQIEVVKGGTGLYNFLSQRLNYYAIAVRAQAPNTVEGLVGVVGHAFAGLFPSSPPALTVAGIDRFRGMLDTTVATLEKFCT